MNIIIYIHKFHVMNYNCEKETLERYILISHQCFRREYVFLRTSEVNIRKKSPKQSLRRGHNKTPVLTHTNPP